MGCTNEFSHKIPFPRLCSFARTAANRLASKPHVASSSYLLLRVAVFALLLSLIPFSIAQGQISNVTDTTSTPTPGVGHDYIHMLNESVNPANGSVSLRIAVPVPPGRKLTLPFAFAYDSNGVHHFVTVGSGFGWLSNRGFLSQGGWTYTVPMMSAEIGQIVYSPDAGQTVYTCDYFTNYMFQDSSGGRHPLDLAHTVDSMSQCAFVNPQPREVSSGGDDFLGAVLTNGTDLTVADADGTTYSFPYQNQNEGVSGGTNTFYGLPTQIADRNGNKATVSDNRNGAFTVTDTVGRIAISSSGFGATGNTVTIAGLPSSYTLTWGTANTNFTPGHNIIHSDEPCSGPGRDSETQPVVTAIALPNGRQYQFFYDGTYGLLNKIVYPSGGYVSYAWGFDPLSEGANVLLSDSNGTYGCVFTYDTPAVIHRYVSFDGSTVALQQDFNYTTNYPSGSELWTTKQTTVTTRDLVRGTNWQTVYNYSPGGTPLNDPNGNSINDTDQTPYEQTVVYKDTNGSTLRTVTKAWSSLQLLGCELTALDNGLITGTWNAYGSLGQVTDKKQYDYGLITSASACQKNNGTVTPPSGITATRETAIVYQSFPNIFDLPSSIKIYGNGTLAAETDYTYDNPVGTTTSGIVQHSGGCNCGNLTQQSHWVDGSGTNKLTTNFTNDNSGQRLTMTDPRGNQTAYSYTDSYSSGTPPGPTNAYLTQITLPNTGVAHIEKFAYAYASGELTSSTDQNNLVTTYKYVDNLARLTEIDYPTPDGGVTTNTYVDTPNAVSIETKNQIDSTRWTDAFTLYDGLGQPIAQSTANGEATPWDRVDTCYDGTGRARFSSYPYQVAAATTAPNCTTGVGDTMTYDGLGRTTQVSHSDGNTILTSYTGRATQFQDEGNGTHRVQRISQIDGLGRLASVCEVTSSSQLGNGGTPAACSQDISATGFLTSYSYNALSDLLSVTQGTLASRTFQYDFLSRLTSATNPESGTISYVYDTDPAGVCPTPYSFAGLLVKKLDARSVRTCYQYVDALNRMTQKNYSDGTPIVSFNYDQTSAYGVSLLNTTGRLTSQSTASPNPTGEVFSYDQLGRVKINSQCTPQNCSTPAVFPVTYTYDLLGDNLTSTNGAGVTLTYAVNTAARLTSLTSSLSDSNHPGTLFSSSHYNAAGALLSATLGGSIGETRTYDARLRLASIADGSNYSLTIPSSGGYAPNSDILAANDSVNANSVYAYDDFNRLTCSNLATNGTCASPTSGTATYTYDYDRYSNRWHQNGPYSMQLSFSGNNNRMDSHSYDAAGNLSNDGSHNYFYDAENRIIQVDGTLGTCSSATACYIYNALGRRVRKTTGSTSVDYLYDLGGQEITELSSAGAWNRGEVYAAGRHLATYNSGTTNLIHADWLGTERVRTTPAGASCETMASLPFGDGQSTTGSCADPSPMHFTGKERDSESGLDNFGARYNSSNMGRFMSPDPMGGHLLDPQTLNRYAYVRNNPLNLTDPTGLDFYLQCTDEKNHNGCTQVQIKGSSTPTWVQADKNGNATIITSDSIRAGDNTATVDEHGVTINGKSQGIYFDNPASQTRDANGTVVDDRNPITLAGSSALKDFTITINGNCGGTCLSSGTWSYPGSLEDARATLYGRGSFSFPGEDEKADLGYGDHTYSTQHRFGASTCPFFSCRNSPHISVPNSWVPVPKDTVPQGFHVDAHGSFIGHQQDVQRKGVE